MEVKVLDPRIVFGIFLSIGIAYSIIWAWVVISARKHTDYSVLSTKITKMRRRIFFILLAVVTVVFLVSIIYLPYEPVKLSVIGKPELTINVVGSMYIWNMSQGQVPSGVPVVFDVTSIDVNHGFGIFTPEGTLFAQVQAMPGYTNKLVVFFDKPGRYPIHCLEYCGSDHFAMAAFIDVT